MKIISADIGGTNSRFQITEFGKGEKYKIIAKKHYHNCDFSSFAEVTTHFLDELSMKAHDLSCLSIGAAGPVVKEKIELTNLPWSIEKKTIAKIFGIKKIFVINDFTAKGYGIDFIKKKDLFTLQKGHPRKNETKAFIGVGTGLGMGFITYDGKKSFVHTSEGGHIDFAPTNETEIALLKSLQKKLGRVSLERVLSGSGWQNIKNFLEKKSNPKKPHSMACVQNSLIDLFIQIYGMAAGNLALMTLPYGGLYLFSSIEPKTIETTKSRYFLENFNNKGRMSKITREIPVYLITDEDVGLLGAAVFAKRNI